MPKTAIKKSNVAVITLGCEKNTVDSEVIGGMLSRRNISVGDDAERADTVIINTCGFIEAAKKESIGAILEAIELKRQGVIKNVFVAGCLSERYRSELESEMPEVDRFFGTQDFEQILKTIVPSSETDLKHNLLGERIVSTARHFAYMKISEGCDHPCSFCAIPIMRGGHRSRSIEELEFEAMMLASGGAKEIVLIAQDSTNYGLDLYGERTLAKLLLRLTRISGIEWIRIMYAYPAKFPLDVLDVMAGEEKIVKYLDIPVQHASTEVLKSMRRGITRRATEELLSKIRDKVPSIALRTTLITGYPTEGEREFEELTDFVEQMQFDRLGVFTFSPEEGTTSWPLEDPISREEKARRQERLYDIQSGISLEKNIVKIGTKERVLIEREESGSYYGRSASQAPEVDGEVCVTNRNDPRITDDGRSYSRSPLSIGDFAFVEFTGATEYDLEAVIVGDAD